MIGFKLHKVGAVSFYWTRRAEAHLDGARKHIFERELDVMWEESGDAMERMTRKLPRETQAAQAPKQEVSE